MIERGEYLGGLLDQCIHNGFGLFYFKEDWTGPEYGQWFIEKANDLGVKRLLKTMVVKLFPDRRMAISSDKGQIHVIDQPKCTKCGTCFDVCPPRFGAVKRLSGEPVPAAPPAKERVLARAKR